jgi:REP-associated tyrosine transposase
MLTVLTVSNLIQIYYLRSKLNNRGKIMSLHSYTKVLLHIIWETHNRVPVLDKRARQLLSGFLFEYCKEKKIFTIINYVNPEHVHILVDLPTNLSIENCVKLLKGSSSHFINKERLTKTGFSWIRGYAAFSVSESQK